MSHVWQSTFPFAEGTHAMLHQEVLGWGAAMARPGRAGRHDRWPVVDATARSPTAAERLAGGLLAGGARQGDVLALVAGNAPASAIVAHGALLAGLTLAPSSPLLTARELGTFLRQTRARYVVADAAAMSRATEAAAAAGAAVLALGALPSADPIVSDGGDPDAIALLMSTSGTSGLPKSAAHTHAGAVATLRQYGASPPRRFEPDDVVAGVVPFAHMFGWVMLNSALRAGARMVTLARFELEAFLRMIQDHRVTRRRRRAADRARAGPASRRRALRPLLAALPDRRRRSVPGRDRARMRGAAAAAWWARGWA